MAAFQQAAAFKEPQFSLFPGQAVVKSPRSFKEKQHKTSHRNHQGQLDWEGTLPSGREKDDVKRIRRENIESQSDHQANQHHGYRPVRGIWRRLRYGSGHFLGPRGGSRRMGSERCLRSQECPSHHGQSFCGYRRSGLGKNQHLRTISGDVSYL